MVLATLLLAVPAIGQGSWTLVPTAPGDPQGYGTDCLQFIAGTGEVLLYGGYAVPTNPAALWSWDGIAWTLLETAAPPGERWAMALSYDDQRDQLVVFGGGRGFYLGDTWERDCVTGAWAERSPANSPPPRFRSELVYDSARHVHVLFGGEGPGGLLDDTWEWDGTNWTEVLTAVRPAPRRAHALVYDARRGKTVLFGGVDLNGVSFGDTWEFDGTAWVQLMPAQAPPARSHAGLVWDSDREVVVLLGGQAGAWSSAGYWLLDGWEWNGTSWTQTPLTLTPPHGGENLTYDALRHECVLYLGTPETWRYVAFGSTTCAGVPNSTGRPGRLVASGTSSVANNDLELHALDLPQGSFGFFLTSLHEGYTVNAGGSQGTLCLNGAIGRYLGPGQVQPTGAAGTLALLLDLSQTPTPWGFTAVMAGETRHFQAWYRDVVAGGVTSNFTGSLSVSFH
ncbi:MAG: hypothetical protein R3F49_08125 [Planctomycetota bacterium]